MKRILSIIVSLCCIVASINFTAVFAAKVEPEIQPLYVVSCSSGGKHRCCNIGTGRVEDPNGNLVYATKANGSVTVWWQVAQCQYCYWMIFSELDPYVEHSLGRYVLQYPGYAHQGAGTAYAELVSMSEIGTFNGSLSADSFWGGFTFIGYDPNGW